MEVYWKLASVDGAVRESASVALVRDLQALHDAYQLDLQKEKGSQHSAEEALLAAAKDDEDGLQNCAPGIQYALRRLVRGVSSSRESARQGFAMALASVLEAFPWIETGSVLKLMKRTLDVSSAMKGQEIRDGLLGQLFALGAVVRARRLVGDDMEAEPKSSAQEITEQLLSLARKKVFLREPAITVLLQLIDRLPSRSLQDIVVNSPLLQDMLCTDIGNGNADVLLLALRLNEQLPMFLRQSCPMLPDSGKLHDILLPSHLSSIVPILKDSSSCHPRLHPVWFTLVDLLFTESKESNPDKQRFSAKKKKRQKVEAKGMFESSNERLASFWSIVVDKALLTSSHERKHLVMELVHLCLPKLTASSAHIVLSSTFVRCLLDILSAKDTHLYKSAQRFLHFLCEWAKEDEHRLVAVILSLQQVSRGKFDMVSKTQTLKELLFSLSSKDGCVLLYESLVGLFIGQWDEATAMKQLQLPNSDSDQPATEKGSAVETHEPGTDVWKTLETQRYWVIEQICSLLKQSQLEPGLRASFQKQTLKLLTMHALFVGSAGTTSTIKELDEVVKWPKVSISENTRQLCLARLQDVLVESSSFKGKNMVLARNSLAESDAGSADPRVFLLQYCEFLSAIPGVTWARNVSEGDKATIDALRTSMLQLSAAVQQTDGEKNERIHAMFSLLMQVLLQSVTSHVNEIAMELIICCKKTLGEFLDIDIEDDENNPESPDIMDVLMDVLLSLLAQSSAPIRAAAEQVFKSFCSDMTKSALLSLLRVVKRQPKSSRRKDVTSMGVEDSDEDELLEIVDSEEDVNDAELNPGEIADSASDHRDPSSDSENEGIEEKRNNQSQHSMKEMISEENNGEDNNPTSDSEMDDEAMFRIDSHLAKLLKQNAQVAARGGAKDAQTQVLHFKFKVLSLIEFFLQKKAKSALAITALPHLLQTFVRSCSVDGNAQLADRIGSILQGKLFKSKQYPKGLDVDNSTIEGLLQKSLKLASRSRIKKVGQVAQACSLWLLKILQSQHQHEENNDRKVNEIIQNAMTEFFSQKKRRLKSSFFREVFIRFPGLGISNLGMLLERCLNSRSEYMQHEAILLATTVLNHKLCREPSVSNMESCELQVSLKQYLPTIGEVLASLLQKPSSKAARRSDARRFCLSLLKTLSKMFPKKPLRKLIGESSYNLCLSHLGASILETTSKSEVMNAPESKFEQTEVGSKHKKTSTVQ